MIQFLAIARTAAANQPGGMGVLFLRLVTRLLQFVVGLTLVGIYASDKFHTKDKLYTQALFATVVGGLSSLVTLIYLIPKVKSYLAFPIDALLFWMHIAVFGIFAKIYLHKKGEMHNAVWVAVAGALLWFCTATAGAFWFWRERRNRRKMMMPSQV